MNMCISLLLYTINKIKLRCRKSTFFDYFSKISRLQNLRREIIMENQKRSWKIYRKIYYNRDL